MRQWVSVTCQLHTIDFDFSILLSVPNRLTMGHFLLGLNAQKCDWHTSLNHSRSMLTDWLCFIQWGGKRCNWKEQPSFSSLVTLGSDPTFSPTSLHEDQQWKLSSYRKYVQICSGKEGRRKGTITPRTGGTTAFWLVCFGGAVFPFCVLPFWCGSNVSFWARLCVYIS